MINEKESTNCSICSSKTKTKENEEEISSNLWLCLHNNCKMLFCSNNESINHKKEHFDSKNHSIMFNLNTKSIYCDLCFEKIDLENNFPSSKK